MILPILTLTLKLILIPNSCERIVENTIRLNYNNENETQFKALLKKFKFIKDIKIKENDNCIEDNK
jgi:hypothetical protein